MYSDTGDTTSLVPGFPIRTSSDQRSVDSSPRHNAASHVLHRLPVPRHPPCALKHLQHKTVKNSRKNQKLHYLPHTTTPTPHKRKAGATVCEMLATTIHKSNTTPHHQSRATTTNPLVSGARTPPDGGNRNLPPVSHNTGRRDSGPVVSKPNSVSDDSTLSRRFPHQLDVCCAPDPHPLQVKRPSTESLQIAVIRTMRAGLKSRGAP